MKEGNTSVHALYNLTIEIYNSFFFFKHFYFETFKIKIVESLYFYCEKFNN